MAFIDPPAADVAARARQRRDACLARLAANKALRENVQAQLDAKAELNRAVLDSTVASTAPVPAEI